MACYVYDDNAWAETLSLVDSTGPYALTERFRPIALPSTRLFEHLETVPVTVNDKPTGAVVGQQPFGGARASGSKQKLVHSNLLRWTFREPLRRPLFPHDWRYKLSMIEDFCFVIFWSVIFVLDSADLYGSSN